MFKTVDEAIEWVTSRKKTLFTEHNYTEYVESLGNPQYGLKCIHVAGTNGKGSTTNYIRAILQAAGYKVGSFTSPHLVTHLDRIRINDENIDGDYFLDMCNKHYKEWEEYQLSMFDIDTIISFYYFLDNKVDYAVYEVGLGGRLDATNVIKPLAAVITNIEMDHMKILGDTIGKIAYEKAGIIKEGLSVVTFEKKLEALNVFWQKAAEMNGQIIMTGPAENVEISDHISFDYKNHHVNIPTIAPYQLMNASAAIEVIDYLNSTGEINVSEQQLMEGLDTFWAGRFEQIHTDPAVYVDGAHNENGIDALCECLKQLNDDYIIIFSALADKNYHKMLLKLLDMTDDVIVTQFDNYRMSSAQDLALGTKGKVIEDWKEAVQYAISQNRTVVITGSLYFVSIIREYFVKNKCYNEEKDS